MLLIIAHHYVVNSGLTLPDSVLYQNPLSWRSLFLLCFSAFGKMGINCFILITGYFMCCSKITMKKFAKLFLELMFYKIVINSIFWIAGYAPFSLTGFVKGILPFYSIAQNFVGCYLVFFLCIPFLNILISHISEKQHIYLILLFSFTYIFFGTVPFFNVSMNYVSWYIVIYFIAAYIRLYPRKLFDNVYLWTLATIIGLALMLTSVVACTWLGTKINKILTYAFVSDSNNFLAVFTAVASFLLFKNIKIKNSKIINTLASTTFGVLLIHANSETMRNWLWKDIVDCVGNYNIKSMPLYAFFSVIIIFVVCSLIDYLRISFIEKPIFKVWDKKFNKISDKFLKLEENLCKKFKIKT